MGYNHHTENYTSKQDRKEKVLQLMQRGDFKAVIQEFEVIVQGMMGTIHYSLCRVLMSTVSPCLCGSGQLLPV